jgi:hypothetical protein
MSLSREVTEAMIAIGWLCYCVTVDSRRGREMKFLAFNPRCNIAWQGRTRGLGEGGTSRWLTRPTQLTKFQAFMHEARAWISCDTCLIET